MPASTLEEPTLGYVTDDAAAALDLARRTGSGTGDLLLGVFGIERSIGGLTLRGLGISATALAEAVRQAAAEPALDGPDEGVGALRRGEEISRTLGAYLNTGTILLNVVAVEHNTGARALAALGVTGQAVRDAMPAAAEASPERRRAVYVERMTAPPPGGLPSRAGVAGRILAGIVGWAALTALVALTAPTLDDAAYDGVVAAGIAAFLTMVVVLRVRLRPFNPRRYLKNTTRGSYLVPPMLTDLAARYGVSTLELRTQLDGRLHNRSLRLGRRAWVVLAPTTMGDERALPFVLAHEVGHVVRNDSRRGLTLIPLRTSLLCAAIMVGTVTAAAVAFAGLLVWTVGTRWTTELAADAFAVRWVGADGFHAFVDQHRTARLHPANRALRYRLGRSTAWLRHPPVPLRLWRADRIAPQ